MSRNDDGRESKGELKAWDLFRNMVALFNGVEEHAKAAEREACCAGVLADREGRTEALRALREHMDATARYAKTARKYLEQLRAMAEGGEHAHLENAETFMTKIEATAAIATGARDALLEALANGNTYGFVCKMSGL